MNQAIEKIFPDIKHEVEETRDAKFWLWLFATSCIILLTSFVVDQLNLTPLIRIADIVKSVVVSYVVVSIVPLRFRPAVFVGSMCLAVILIFGLVVGTVLLCLVLFAFIILQLPLQVYVKGILLFGFLGALAVLRIGFVQVPRIQIVVPYAAALIMFRSVIWLHEAQHHPMKESFWMRLSYFFCLPNLAFLFFPIVDYRVHLQFYYNTDSPKIWRKGLTYIFSGILQFVLYRLIRNSFNVSLNEVNDVFSFTQMVLVNYASLLQFSGTITVGAGFLCLYGFNLPSPFGNFYVAESLFKYWQRVNIYWNEFLLKLTYYPIYFKWRKRTKFATEISLLATFIATCFFHWYQKFWITGIVKMPLNDLLFWSILGVLVILSSLYNKQFPDNNVDGSFFKNQSIKAAKATAVFVLMATLIWLWNVESVQEVLYLTHSSFSNSLTTYQLPAVLAALFLFQFIFSLLTNWIGAKSENLSWSFGWYFLGWFILLIAAIAVNQEVNDYGQSLLKHDLKTRYERTTGEVDYYESILTVSSGKWNTTLASNAPTKNLKKFSTTTGDILLRKLTPLATQNRNGFHMHVNSMGLRDKEYTLSKPDGVYRIALLGGSYEMGSGVDDWCVFENIVEKDLQKQKKKIELINFSMGGYTMIQYLYLLDTKLPEFHPDAIIIFSHTRDSERYAVYLTNYFRNGIDMHYAYFNDLAKRSGVEQEMSKLEMRERLIPLMDEMVEWTFDTIGTICKQRSIRPIWIHCPTTLNEYSEEAHSQHKSWAVKNGFECFSMQDAFDGFDAEKIQVSENDSHPNCFGHKLLAGKFSKIIAIIDSTKKR